MRRLLLHAALLAAVTATAIVAEQGPVTPVPTPATLVPTPAPAWDGTCDDLKNIMVNGKDWTDVVKTVCNFWPTSQFGQFPAATLTQLDTILSKLFEAGGVWDQLKTAFSTKKETYCLRQEVSREIKTSAAQDDDDACPAVLDDELLDEMPGVIDGSKNQELLTGYWACVKAGGDCECSRRDSLAGDGIPPGKVAIASRPSNCEMVHNGACYGNCPRGYRPTFLIGWFRPVCTSVCAATNHPVTCGVGCANSRTSCAAVIMNQVKEVAILASKVAAFFTAGPGGAILAETVEKVVKVAEFGFNVLGKVLAVADAAYKKFTREEANLATLTAIFEIIKEAVADIGKDWLVWLSLFDDAGKLFVQLIDANFGWKNINLGWISGVVMQNGAAALAGAFQVTKAFAYGKCDLATDEVAFTIENVGDQRVIGPWSHDGSVNGKPRYRALRNRADTLVEWSSRAKSWSVWVKDTSFGRGWWFGWIGFGWRELYDTQSAKGTFPTTGWRKLEGALPLPLLVDAKNGGV